MTAPTALDPTGIAELLGRGGCDVSSAGSASYNPLADPPGAEALGQALANALREVSPTVVLVWERPEDGVLGHVVARELGLRAVRAYDAEGLVGHGPGLDEGARIALVADAIRDVQPVRAARGLADQLGGALVATAVLVATPELDEIGPVAGHVVSLAHTPEAAA